MIARADGSPLYNLAVAIDDHDAGITHVVRGEDHISNTPKQLLVLEAIGAPEPLYAHLPLLHGADGKKLSKRHGAASVQDLRDAGYLPEAVRNYLALLGWGDTDDETLIPTDELVAALRRRPRLQEPGALRRAEAALDERPLPARARDRGADAPAGGVHRPRGARATPSRSARRRSRRCADFWPLAGFIFDGPADDEAAREKWLGEEGSAALADARAALDELARLERRRDRRRAARRRGAARRRRPRPSSSRCASRWRAPPISPGIFETLAVLGREESLRRLDARFRRRPDATLLARAAER